jgi:1,4-dihydroxy-2-naphthoate polyprenyltransferase
MNRIKIWMSAIRPKTLTASLVPVIVGSALAFNVQGKINFLLAFWMFLSSVFIQVGTNLINDALDFKKGADTDFRLGPKRMTQTGLISFETVLKSGFFSLFLAFLFGIPLIIHGGAILLVILLLSILLAYLYTGGPFPLAYVGLGDLFVFLFFGLISTAVAFYIQTGFWNGISLLAGSQIGLLATSLIAVNNLRDYKGDAYANKRTLAVRFGVLFSRIQITLLLTVPFLLGLVWISLGNVWAGGLPFILIPFAGKIIRSIWEIDPSREYNQLLGFCAFLQLMFASFLSIGFLVK